MQEEITHCAAGVCWLTYLHSLGHSDAFPRRPHAAAAQSGVASASTSVAAGASSAEDRGLAEEGDAASNEFSSEGSSAVPEWVQEARMHATVESWFHQLVRQHFRGSIKVRDSLQMPDTTIPGCAF